MSEDCVNIKVHTHEPKIGCSKAAHAALGWCAGFCSNHTPLDECAGWRLLHGPDDPHPHGAKGCADHKLVQHRDGKKPWCRKCGRDEKGNVIGRVRSWLRP